MLIISSSVSSSGKTEEESLVIYAYDSFVADWGPAGIIIPAFEEETGIPVKILGVGDAGQVLSRALLEAENPKADIILGIDNNMLSKALESEILSPYKPRNIDLLPEDLLFDPSYHVIPFDYGFFSIIYDSEKIADPPRSLEDLTEERFRDDLILMDPRTSSPGLGFLLWTIYAYGDNYPEYWERLQPSILTITEGWDSGYGLFTAGEAPLVLSYTTSPAYHVEYEETDRYQAAVFDKGNYMQIEGMGIVKNAPHRKSAEAFMDFILTEKFQKAIPLTNFMYPVNPQVKLPSSFDYAPKALKSILLDPGDIAGNREKWLSEWTEALTR